jgi:hypothetical protein
MGFKGSDSRIINGVDYWRNRAADKDKMQGEVRNLCVCCKTATVVPILHRFVGRSGYPVAMATRSPGIHLAQYDAGEGRG